MVGVTFARVNEEHLADSDLAAVRTIEAQPAGRDDEGHRDGVPVLGHPLARLEPQADHPHRAAVRDLLETERTPGIARV